MGVLDDLDLVIQRYNDLKARRKVRKFVTSFQGEYAIYDLNNPNNIYEQKKREAEQKVKEKEVKEAIVSIPKPADNSDESEEDSEEEDSEN